MKSQTLRFHNEAGMSLAARLDLPQSGEARFSALFAHCFTCTKNISAVRHIARGLTSRQIGVLSFDFTGLGQSEGQFSSSDFANQAGDLVAAARYMEGELQATPLLLIGHSLGGTASLYAARQIESVRGVVTIGSPVDPQHVIGLFTEGLDEVERRGVADVCIGGRPFSVDKRFIEDLQSHPPENWLGELRADLLIFHAPGDKIVSIDNAERIFKAVRHPKSFVSLAQADHLLSRSEDAAFVAATIAGWAERLSPRTAAPSAPLQTDMQVVVRIGRQNYTTEIVAGKHSMIADEPPSVGGADMGGTPVEYLLGALGACTAITMRMYAERKGYPLEEARVHLSHTTDTSGESIACQLELFGDLTDEQRTRITRIADHCPVHRTLEGQVHIDTSLRR